MRKDADGRRAKLQVDHKLPLTWGGTNNIKNLQALCLDCNHGKRDFLATFDAHADKIRHAALPEPHKRIGGTLKAFHSAGEYAPSEVVGLAACMIQYQDDWQKRMRELRQLHWDYRTHKRKEDRRIRSYYEVTRWTPWPSGPVAATIKQIEKSKKLISAAAP
ncbi:HNH endonuclease [Arthrobacter sp. Z1-9]